MYDWYTLSLLSEAIKKHLNKEKAMPGSPMPTSPFGRAPVIAVETPRLHPLHTVEFLHQQMVHTGRYPDIDRCTGRTTILALKALVAALENPHTPVDVRDHHNTENSHVNLVKQARAVARALDLQHLEFNTVRKTITFTRANPAPAYF